MQAFRRHYLRVMLLALLARVTPVTAQPVDQSPAAIDQFVSRLMDSANVPGLSLVFMQENRVAYSRGYGLTVADSTQRVTSATVFDAASLSKPVFAYAVLQLVEAGLLDLDKPLYQYLPYPDVADDERYKQITARLVLSHSSGLPNWRKNRKSTELTMAFTPGDRFGYSGEGFVYLQRVVEKITGKPINDLMTERVFRPLQMTRSSYVWNPAFDADFALPHDEQRQPGPKGKSNRANVAYSLQTTADDYARFVLAIFANTGLQPATIGQMLTHQRQLPERLSKGKPLSDSLFWGLGIGLEETPAGTYLWHWGDNDAYKCFVIADRARGSGLVYFTNSTNGLSIVGAMLSRFIGGEHPAVSFLNYEAYTSFRK